MVTKNANLVEKEFIIMQEIEDEKIEFYEGSDTAFTLNGKQIVIQLHGNKLLRSIDNWQKADILLDEYRRYARKRALKKAKHK